MLGGWDGGLDHGNTVVDGLLMADMLMLEGWNKLMIDSSMTRCSLVVNGSMNSWLTN